MTQQTEPQLASAVLMIRPVRFESNPMTAASNRFQGRSGVSPAEQQAAALREFDGLVAALRENGVEVVVVDDTPEPHTPDSIFPNNWISTHADGTVVLYPMEAVNRRTERREDILEKLTAEQDFRIKRVLDLTGHEEHGRHLEGTGSMVLDRSNRVTYACLSSRTHEAVLKKFATAMNYDVVSFDAVDRGGVPIYHTNVLMNVGEKVAVICDEAIRDAAQRQAVLDSLRATGHDIVRLTYAQLEAFAGNMLELRDLDGKRVLAMSRQAFASLTDEQRDILRKGARIVQVPIDTIEGSAGGSVRCMLAEIHLPRNN